MTLALCVICIGASLVTGYALYLLESVAKGGWSRFNDGFVAVFRNTPPLVQIYLFYFGLGVYLNPVLRLTSAGFMTPGVSGRYSPSPCSGPPFIWKRCEAQGRRCRPQSTRRLKSSELYTTAGTAESSSAAREQVRNSGTDQQRR